jgi:DNA invertase Pin-like site-specific DNA recombinase|tara:strand:+ start:243 stop:869 length:627 start_codon:yes stop_codon:yes gene_type:complete
MIVKYIRVSTVEQNLDRQEADFKGKIYKDEVSGSIAFKERTEASKLILNKDITEVHVHSIDRLGRDTIDIMQTIQYFTDKGINVVSNKEGLSTIVGGKENPIAKMMIGILGTLAEFELSRAKERQTEGIANAKLKGVYVGRKKGTKETDRVFWGKDSTQRIVKYLNKGESIQRTALLSKTSTGKVKKVKRFIKDGKWESMISESDKFI